MQVIVVRARDGLNFVRSEVRSGVTLENRRYQPFSALDHLVEEFKRMRLISA